MSHRNLISFHLVPSSERRAQIERDYRGMVDMFMATPPSFETIMAELAGIERQINDRVNDQLLRHAEQLRHAGFNNAALPAHHARWWKVGRVADTARRRNAPIRFGCCSYETGNFDHKTALEARPTSETVARHGSPSNTVGSVETLAVGGASG